MVPDPTRLRTRNPTWTPRPTERTTTTTRDNLRVTFCENEPPSGGSERQSHRQRSTTSTSHPDRSTSHYPAATRQPALKPYRNPWLHTGTPTRVTLRPQPSHTTKRRTHGLCQPQIPKHRAGPGTAGAGQAAAAPRPQPRRRYPKDPSTNTPDPPSASSPKTDPLNYERHELPATRPRLPSSPEPI